MTSHIFDDDYYDEIENDKPIVEEDENSRILDDYSKDVPTPQDRAPNLN